MLLLKKSGVDKAQVSNESSTTWNVLGTAAVKLSTGDTQTSGQAPTEGPDYTADVCLTLRMRELLTHISIMWCYAEHRIYATHNSAELT